MKTPGNSATKITNTISTLEIQNIGRLRRSRQASSQRLLLRSLDPDGVDRSEGGVVDGRDEVRGATGLGSYLT